MINFIYSYKKSNYAHKDIPTDAVKSTDSIDPVERLSDINNKIEFLNYEMITGEATPFFELKKLNALKKEITES